MKKFVLILALIIVLCLAFVIVISYIGRPKAPKPTLQEQLATVDVDLKVLELTLGDYFSTHNTFADSLTSLTTPIAYFGTRPVAFMATIPVDPFNLDRRPVGKAKNPYKYIKQGEGENVQVTLYSYGPDKDDDNASVAYDPRNGARSNGDIVRPLSAPAKDALRGAPGHWYPYENCQIARASDDNGIKDFMWAMKSLRCDLRNTTDSASMDLARTVMRESWQGDVGNLEALLERNQQAFSLIHEGAKKPFAKEVIIEKELTIGHGFPNFISMQVLTQLMICQGKKLEAEGTPEQAIRNYIDTVKFGQSAGSGLIIGKILDVMAESMAYKALQKALINSQLDRSYLEELLERLKELEKSSPPLAIALRHEQLAHIHAIERTDSTKEYSKTYPKPKGVPAFLFSLFMKDKIVKMMIENNRKFWTGAIEYSKKPYPEAITFDIRPRIEIMDPFTEISIPQFAPTLTQDTKRKAYASGAMIMAALELLKSRNNTYPDKIDALGDILKPIPLDPFTEKNFRYEKVGDAYRLYSVGPDMRDDFGALVYDPTNGTQSTGDIIFRK